MAESDRRGGVYRWDDQTQTWTPTGEQKPRYADLVEAEKVLEERRRERDERDQHPGHYL